MGLIKAEPYEIVECMRCGKAEFLGNAQGWNTVFDMGVIVGHLCPDCQTDEEHIEAEVNAATIDYSQLKVINSIPELLDMARALTTKALQTIARGETRRGNAELQEALESFRKGWNAMNRYNLDVQLEDADEAYALLVEFGVLPEL